MSIHLNNIKGAVFLVFASLSIFTAQYSSAQSGRNTSEYNLENGVGLKGYDPVAAFPEGGGFAQVGQAQFRAEYLGVTYLFANEQNRDLFLLSPEKYEPTYGGWNAYSMGLLPRIYVKTDIIPRFFTIHGNRAHYFVSRSSKARFDEQLEIVEATADENWKAISGEDPRF